LSGLPHPSAALSDSYSRLRSALSERYRLERELGRGGMATVYLAHDLKHDRPVALKVLRPEIAAALGSERFQREIQFAARLQHPHILSVYDSGEADGELWFTMPFVEGESLRDRLDREHQLPVEEALRIARETAEALDYAHRRGVIHRDVKPENILLTESHALVADFGIARALGREEHLTSTGVAIGTPAYMSPEQASGDRELDARSDVYALGCVLYEMLAGEPPYTGPTAQAILARARTERPRPIRPLRPAVPEALDRVIARAMAGTPADRFASAAAFAAALGSAAEMRTAPPLRRRSPLFAMLAFGFLLGVGVLFAWRRTRGGDDGAAPKLLAVLPFENLGSPEDEYFADGITDEVRGKLSALTGLQVIARASSWPFKQTTKTPEQIAQELGAQYLLTGTVRWEKHPGGSSSVHVSPELVLVRRGAAPTTQWQQSFDAELTNVFQVQADIASRVARSLGVALDPTAQQLLAERPTANLAAYDAFLRGDAITQGFASGDPAIVRRALPYYEQAVALDSTFAQAWARLSLSYTTLYFNSGPTPARAEGARRGAERAVALAPNSAWAHGALGSYYVFVLGDNRRSLAEYTEAHRLAPGNAPVLTSLATNEAAHGQWQLGLEHMQQAERLDPRSVITIRRFADYLLRLRRYPEALEAHDRGLAIAPTNLDLIEHKAMVFLGQGDLAKARTFLATTPKEIESTALVAMVANYYDLMWVLDDAQQGLLLRLRPDAFDGDRGSWGIVLAQTYALRGDIARARIYADTARIGFAEQLRAAPRDPQRHVLLGLALAYLGRKADAIREGERGVALLPIAKDAVNGPYYQHQLARIYMIVNEPDKALDQLEPLLKTPYYLSPGWLRIDPNFDPIRSEARFRKLAGG
jgi:eukaryotic-like serine/threonine-protein kinase